MGWWREWGAILIAEKYDTTPFDPNDPCDIRSEKARRAVIDAFLACDGMIETGDDLKDVASGLFFGIVSILAAHTELTDENHAALRAGLLQMITYIPYRHVGPNQRSVFSNGKSFGHRRICIGLNHATALLVAFTENALLGHSPDDL